LTQSRKKGTVVGVANGKFETLRDNEKSISCARPKPFHFLEWERKLSEIYELHASLRLFSLFLEVYKAVAHPQGG